VSRGNWIISREAVKDDLGTLYEYLDGEKGITIRSIAYPFIGVFSHYFLGSYVIGVVIDLYVEALYKMGIEEIAEWITEKRHRRSS